MGKCKSRTLQEEARRAELVGLLRVGVQRTIVLTAEGSLPIAAVEKVLAVVNVTNGQAKAFPKPASGRESLRLSIDELDLSVRASRCMRDGRISMVRQLVRMTAKELEGVPGFTRFPRREVELKLGRKGLRLEMSKDDIAGLAS